MNRTVKTVFLAILITASSACTRKVYIPMENISHTTDTLHIASIRADTVYKIDSISLIQKGDTIIKESWRWRYKTRILRDTVYATHRDSISTSQAIPIEEKRNEKPSLRLLFVAFLAGIVATMLLLRRK